MFQSQAAYKFVAKFVKHTADGVLSAVNPVDTGLHPGPTKVGVWEFWSFT